jgi:hypothetical protein
MNKVPTVETEQVKVGGKTVFTLYLVPEGYEKVDDDNGYTVIAKVGTATPAADVEDEEHEDEELPPF